MNSDPALAIGDMQRLLHNMIRVGTIHSVDHGGPGKPALVRVSLGELVTDWRPYHEARAGCTTTWNPPTVGEQATVLSPSGDLGAAVVVVGLNSTGKPAPSSDPNKTITLRGRAANMLDELRTLKDRSWHKTTVGTIVRSIASQNKLKVSIDKEIALRKIGHADQAQESDASFLRRLGRQMDCLCNIKNGTLLFSQARKARTPSGKELPPVTITRDAGDQHRWARSDRDSYSGVKAFYNNIKRGTRSSVVAGISGRAKTLRQTYANEADALAAARAEWLRIQRGIYSFDITLAYGRADVMPQRPVIVSGWKKQIDETVWMVTAVRHSLSSSGYISQLTLETQQSEGVDGGDEAYEN